MTPSQSIRPRLARYWRLATRDGVARRALGVAVGVGTILNLINQGDALLAGGAVHYGKLALTYIVPFIVSTHGAVSARSRAEAG